MVQTPSHTPVLLETVLSVLDPKPGESVLDVTTGLGGHARAFLERTAPDGRLIALDADPDNLALAREHLAPFGNRVQFLHANFRDCASLALPQADIILADLGLSSPHLDDPRRGFSFRTEAALDLRFDRTAGDPAALWIQKVAEQELVKALRDFGELPGAGRLARALKASEIRTTSDVVRIAEEVYGWRAKSLLPQFFQALRIAVNDELGALEEFLLFAPGLLTPGGRLGIISYHSLEDRRVKQTFRSLTTAPKNPHTGQDAAPSDFTLLMRKAIISSAEEVSCNPRSRSAKFRAIRRARLPS